MIVIQTSFDCTVTKFKNSHCAKLHIYPIDCPQTKIIQYIVIYKVDFKNICLSTMTEDKFEGKSEFYEHVASAKKGVCDLADSKRVFQHSHDTRRTRRYNSCTRPFGFLPNMADLIAKFSQWWKNKIYPTCSSTAFYKTKQTCSFPEQ